MTLLRIAEFEVGKLLASRRGWLAILAFALLWSVVVFYALLPAARLAGSPDAGSFLAAVLGRFGLESLARWPHPSLALYWLIAPYCLPLFAVVAAADQIASDRARGTLRFLALRATRTELFVGRYLGQCVILCLLAIVTLLSVVAVQILTGAPVVGSIDWLLPIGLHIVVILLPYAAMMSLFSVLARSARQALWLAIVASLLVWLASMWLSEHIVVPAEFPATARLLLPGATSSELVRRLPGDAWALIPVPLLQTLALLGAGWLAMRRVSL